VLNVSSTGCNNERQLFAKLSYSAVDSILTNLLPAGLQDFCQVLNVSNDDGGKQAVGVLLRSKGPPGLSLGCSAANFLKLMLYRYLSHIEY